MLLIGCSGSTEQLHDEIDSQQQRGDVEALEFIDERLESADADGLSSSEVELLKERRKELHRRLSLYEGMQEYALQMDRGQDSFYLRNRNYFEPEHNVYEPDADDPEWTHLLEFNPQVPERIDIVVEAGESTSCTICEDFDPSTNSEHWFAVRVYDALLDESLLLTNQLEEPVMLDGPPPELQQ